MNDKRTKAIALRLEGKSYNEISKELLISKSTLSGWLKEVPLSDKASGRLKTRVSQGTLNSLVVRNKLQTVEAQERASQIQLDAEMEIPEISKENLLLIGTALYWAEGYKRPIIRGGKEVTSHAISFVNSDPYMIRMFIRFLLEILGVPLENIRATMRLYEHMNENEAHQYWKSQTNLPEECFRKTTFQVSLSSKGIRPFNRLEHGTLQIGVYETAKFHKILGFIEGMKLQAGYATILSLVKV